MVVAFAGGCSQPPEPTLTVFAAASLRNAFTAIGERFESENPGVRVDFSFAGSADLLTQLLNGAPADVFAAADTTTMDQAARADLVAGAPAPFAANTLTIVVAPGNPRNVTALRDLTRPELAVVVCAAQVPCGAATTKVEAAAGVRLRPVSEESQVTDVLTKVTSGQADAGLVYVTDAKTAGAAVTAVPFSEAAGAANTYPIAVLTQSASPDLARRFVDIVTGMPGQDILANSGFAPAR